MGNSIRFLGGAGTVTGSKFVLEFGGTKTMVDCGMFQGLKSLRLQNWEEFPIPPSEIDSILLTHAHLDHSGYIPLIVKNGFQGKIYCTAPTLDLARVILLDSAKIQEEDAHRANQYGYSKHKPAKPLYGVEDAERALRKFYPVPLGTWQELNKNLRFRFTQSGHILGSSLVEVETPKCRVAFTGDLGRTRPLILPPPDFIKSADYLVVESTYGDRCHSEVSALDQLEKLVNETIGRGGQVLIPAFAIGRTQDILYLLSKLREAGRMPEVPVYLDSPMGTRATEIFADYPDWHSLTPEEVSHAADMVTLVGNAAKSEELLRREEPAIIIAGSGMLSGGRILSHLLKRLPDAKNTVILVGFQPAGTRGSLLRAGATEVKIYGQYVPVRAKIEEIPSLSAHADQAEMLEWLGHFTKAPKETFIVHGEPQAADALRVRIQDKFGWKCTIPRQDQTVPILD